MNNSLKPRIPSVPKMVIHKLTLFRWAFAGLLTDGGVQKDPLFLKSVTHILQ